MDTKKNIQMQLRMMFQWFLRNLPEPVKNLIRKVKGLLLGIVYRGTDRFCPICRKSHSRFLTAGVNRRRDARCISCDSLERHRLLSLFFDKTPNLFFSGMSMLHVAPEFCLKQKLKEFVGDGYLTADLLDPNVMMSLDITNMTIEDESFDTVICNHVLEHV
ncbi:MAG TPA: methyltransferase domain-containing protein, partial [Pontiella sp.]